MTTPDNTTNLSRRSALMGSALSALAAVPLAAGIVGTAQAAQADVFEVLSRPAPRLARLEVATLARYAQPA